MDGKTEWTRARVWRRLLQTGFLLLTLEVGIRFGLFVSEAAAGAPITWQRPPAVEGFLPIGALVSLKNWLLTGSFERIHPAALVLLLTFVGISLIAKKGFCSWLCPIGTLSNALAAAGRRLFGRNVLPPRWLDAPLRALKYLGLAFFVKLIVIDMPAAALGGFLSSPYWASADVRMLYFFIRPSTVTIVVLAVLVVLSLAVRDAWCRYLCPYGALLGLVSFASPFKIRRDTDLCTNCGACRHACPSRLPVDARTTVRSPECTACLRCTDSCPQPGALGIALPGRGRRHWPGWAFAALVLVLFLAGVGTGMATGHWQGALNAGTYRWLIPLAAGR